MSVERLLGTGASIAALLGFGTGGWKAYHQWLKPRDAARRAVLIDAVTTGVTENVKEEIGRQLDPIKAEMRTNGGASLKDSLGRIESNQETMARRFDAVEGRLVVVDGKVAAVDEKFDAVKIRLDGLRNNPRR